MVITTESIAAMLDTLRKADAEAFEAYRGNSLFTRGAIHALERLLVASETAPAPAKDPAEPLPDNVVQLRTEK